MTLGWKTGLSGEVSEPFMRSGTMHIFAISGLHIALIAAMVVGVLRCFAIPRSVCCIVVIPLIWIYTGITGWQASAIRSTIMTSVMWPVDAQTAEQPRQFAGGCGVDNLDLGSATVVSSRLSAFLWRCPESRSVGRCSRSGKNGCSNRSILPDVLRSKPQLWLVRRKRVLSGVTTSLAACSVPCRSSPITFTFSLLELNRESAGGPAQQRCLASNMAVCSSRLVSGMR